MLSENGLASFFENYRQHWVVVRLQRYEAPKSRLFGHFEGLPEEKTYPLWNLSCEFNRAQDGRRNPPQQLLDRLAVSSR